MREGFRRWERWWRSEAERGRHMQRDPKVRIVRAVQGLSLWALVSWFYPRYGVEALWWFLAVGAVSLPLGYLRYRRATRGER